MIYVYINHSQSFLWFMTFFYPHYQRLNFPCFFGLPKIREVFAVSGTTGDSVSCQEGSWLQYMATMQEKDNLGMG